MTTPQFDAWRDDRLLGAGDTRHQCCGCGGLCDSKELCPMRYACSCQRYGVDLIPTESDIPMHGWAPYSDVHRERIRAHAKHDDHGQSMERKRPDDRAWLPVLVEEVGEVARALNYDSTSNLRDELVQVAAMACAWIESIDKAEGRQP